MNHNLMTENNAFVQMYPPADQTAGIATTVGNAFSMKEHNHATIVIMTGAIAGGTGSFTIQQGTTVAMADSKALAFTRYWTNDAAPTTSVLTETAGAAVVLDTANSIYIIEVDAATLDTANNFDCVEPILTAAGAADFSSCLAILSQSRYTGNPVADVMDD